MPDPKFTKPWHGVPREQIEWNPTVIEDACIGCGTCVTGCNRLVYRYDFDRHKAVVVDPLNCMVGCTTCANTCPTNAIRFPPLSSVFTLEGRPAVRHAIEDDLIARRDQLEWHDVVPHPERIVSLRVAGIVRVGTDTRVLTLAPLTPVDALCQFMPGQYLEILPPGTGWLARAYSIGNAPRADGSVELQVRRVPGGRMSEWLFERVSEGSTVRARGPFGHFTFRSAPGTPLVFVAGGTGFAPVKAMIEQQLGLDANVHLRLFWGAGRREDLYELDLIAAWTDRHPFFHCTLAVEHGPLPEGLGPRIVAISGRVAEAIAATGEQFPAHDAYIAGPPAMVAVAVEALIEAGIDRERMCVDSFGI